MADTSVHALIEAAGINRPGSGLRFLDRREQATMLTWPMVLDRARRVAGALRALGVKHGDTVAIILPTDPAFADVFFGCQVAGAVPVPLYPPVRLGRLDEYHARTAAMLTASRAVVVVTEPRIARVLGRTIEAATPPLGVVRAADLLEGAAHEPEGIAPDDLALVQFSSGTTVEPKPVALTHRQVIANAARILDVVLTRDPLDGPTPAGGVSWLPLYHDMGLIGCVYPALLAPGPLTLLPPEAFLAKPILWLRALSTYKGTISPAPNFAYELILERVGADQLEGLDLSSWHMALDGAEPVSADTLRRFAEHLAPTGFDARALMPVYGLSEAALAVTFSSPYEPLHSLVLDADALPRGQAVPSRDGIELVGVGKPLPDFEVHVRDAEGEAVPARTVGRIHVRGPSLMRGYLHRDAQPFVDGWLDTGDLGFLDLDGELFVTGRAKDVLILRGQNHAPHDLERAVDGVEGVRTGCAAAVADLGAHGERVLLFVEVRTAVEGQADACTRAVKAATGITPDLVVLLDPGTLPRTSSGKIRRAETLRTWQAGTLTPPDRVTPLHLAGAFAGSALAYLRTRWRQGGP